MGNYMKLNNGGIIINLMIMKTKMKNKEMMLNYYQMMEMMMEIIMFMDLLLHILPQIKLEMMISIKYNNIKIFFFIYFFPYLVISFVWVVDFRIFFPSFFLLFLSFVCYVLILFFFFFANLFI